MKALIIRHCAYGDAIHASHLPRLLHSKGYTTIDVNTNLKGSMVFLHNPFIANLVVEEISTTPAWLLEKHWQVIAEGYDKVINLYASIEYDLLAMENDNTYYMSGEIRRQRYEGINFYDHTTVKAGYLEDIGKFHGEMFFTDKEHEIVRNWIDLPKFKDKTLVMINISGSGPHKRMVQAREIADRLLETHNDIHIITTGSAACKSVDFADELGDRATSITGRFPFRQAALVTKYMDCVIGCESGLMCAATMWETPVIQLMTATDINAHCKYNTNDYSLQSPCRCSPCYKGPYSYYGCPSKDGNPLCVYFSVEDIVNQYKKVDNARVTV